MAQADCNQAAAKSAYLVGGIGNDAVLGVFWRRPSDAATIEYLRRVHVSLNIAAGGELSAIRTWRSESAVISRASVAADGVENNESGILSASRERNVYHLGSATSSKRRRGGLLAGWLAENEM